MHFKVSIGHIQGRKRPGLCDLNLLETLWIFGRRIES